MPLLPNTRNTLYSGFPINVKMALRSRLLSFNIEEEVCLNQILLFLLLKFGRCLYIYIYDGGNMFFFLQLTISLIKAKMEKTLGWISLMAENTIK